MTFWITYLIITFIDFRLIKMMRTADGGWSNGERTIAYGIALMPVIHIVGMALGIYALLQHKDNPLGEWWNRGKSD